MNKENIIFSPLSITSLFGTLLPGSDNVTFSEIQETFNFSPTESIHLESTKETLNEIRSLNGLRIVHLVHTVDVILYLKMLGMKIEILNKTHRICDIWWICCK